MAIENIGLAIASSAAKSLDVEGGYSVRIHDGDTGGVFLRFRTMQGADFLTSFNVALSWRGVPKATATNGATIYGAWATVTKEVSTSGLTARNVNGLVEWAINLSAVAAVSTWGASTWSFAGRKYDEVEFQISVSAAYDGGVSPTATATSWVGWIPTYTVDSAEYDKQYLTVHLARSSAWLRKDDRWCVKSLTLDGTDILDRTNGDVWGQVGGGLARIPLKSLTRKPKPGSVAAELRINASYKSQGSTLATAAGVKAMADHSTCNTPQLSASVSGSTVVVSVTDSGDKGVPITRVSVSLRGSSLAIDTVECNVPGSATFRSMPVGPLTFDAVGTDSVTSTGISATVSVDAVVAASASALATVTDLDSGEVFEIRYEPGFAMSGAPDIVEDVIAGRDRPTVYVGETSDVTGTLSGALVGLDAGARARKLMLARRLLVRTPEGYRRVCANMGVSYDWERGGGTVSVSLKEVC